MKSNSVEVALEKSRVNVPPHYTIASSGERWNLVYYWSDGEREVTDENLSWGEAYRLWELYSIPRAISPLEREAVEAKCIADGADDPLKGKPPLFTRMSKP